MAIQITKQPADISWSRNPILYEFYTDRIVQDYGRPLIFELDFSDVENDTYVASDLTNVWREYYDWSIRLTFGSTVLFISCQYNPNSSLIVIPHRRVGSDDVPLETKAEWLFRVRTVLENNFNIESSFDISVDDDRLIFSSRVNDEGLVVGLDNNVTELPVHLSVTQVAVSLTYTPNLKIFVELFVYSDAIDNNEALISAALVPDKNGVARWDLSNPLTSACLVGSDVVGYFVQVTELYGEPQAVRQTIKGSLKTVVYGGLPKTMLHVSLIDSLTVDGLTCFLTTSQYPKLVTADQLCSLSWLNIGDNLDSVKVHVELTYNDDSVFPFTAHTYGIVYRHEKIVIPVGLDQLGANALYPELSIVSYTVTLKSNGEYLSPSAEFIVDSRSLTYKRFFQYKNSLGAFETFYSYGRKSIAYEISKSNASVIQSLPFVLEKGGDIDFDISLQEKEKINTGWKTKSEIRAMRDFFLSSEKLMLVDGRWWPISVTSNTIDEFADGNGMFALAFEIQVQHTQELFFDN